MIKTGTYSNPGTGTGTGPASNADGGVELNRVESRWLARGLKTTQATAKLAASLAVGKIRGGDSKTEHAGSARAGVELAEALGSLKGVAMKVGQTASYVDSFQPPAVSQALQTLQSASHGMSPGAVDGVFFAGVWAATTPALCPVE